VEEKPKKDASRSEENLLAHERTILAQERTLMAWVRTSLSLIGFGFTIFRVFKDLHKDSMLPGGNSAAQDFGVILVVLGTGFLIAASIQHKFLEKEFYVKGIKKRISLPFLAAICISLLGIVMLLGIFFHLGPLD
jgi:putative membrane protein